MGMGKSKSGAKGKARKRLGEGLRGELGKRLGREMRAIRIGLPGEDWGSEGKGMGERTRLATLRG